MKSRMFPWVIGVKGLCAVIAQTLLARELLVVFGGNELTLGIIFSVWLIAGSAGSAVIGRFWHQGDEPRRLFGFFILFFCLTLPLSLLALRSGRLLLHIPFGEVLTLYQIILICFMGCALPAIADGAIFTLAARLTPAAGHITLWESLGVIAGGIFFTFILAPVANAVAIAFGVAAVSSVCLALLLRDEAPPGEQRRAWLWCVFFLLLLTQSAGIQKATLNIQWPGKTLAAYTPSDAGNIAVTREDGALMLFHNGVPARPEMPSEDFVRIPMLARPLAKEVLFIGASPDGLLAEMLTYPIRRLTVAALDPALVGTLRRQGVTALTRSFEDRRLRIVTTDSRRFLRTTREHFDVIFVETHLPTSLAVNRYYTEEFFKEAARRLNDRGLLIVTSSGSLSFLSEELKRINASLMATLQRAFASVTVIPGDGINIFCASNQPVSLDPYVLSQNISTYRINAPLIDAAYLESRLQTSYRDWFLTNIHYAPSPVNRDLNPVGFYQALDLSYAQYAKRTPKFFDGMQKIRTVHLLALIVVVFFSWRRLVPRKTALAKTLNATILTTGFFAMALQVVVLLLFQSVSGSLFGGLALFTAAFMAGGAAGAWLAVTQEKRWTQLNAFLWIEWGLPVGGVLCVLGTIAGLNLFFAASAVAGFLAGSQVPLVFEWRRTRERLTQEEASNLASRLYGLDLLGAGAGALAALILIPGCGFIKTILILFFIKIANAWNLTSLKR